MAIMEIFLQPGDWYFGDKDTRIRTLLGSCIAITIWHPRLRVGGMCHFLLPGRGVCTPSVGLDGRYGDEAIAALMQELWRQRTHPGEYVCKIFGGGNMFQTLAARSALKDFLQKDAPEIIRAVKAAARANLRNMRSSRSPSPETAIAPPVCADLLLQKSTEKVIAVGTSTGGTQALEILLRALPVTVPGIVVVQHMPEKFKEAIKLGGVDEIVALTHIASRLPRSIEGTR
jgi:hypothetical protein